ncbi:ribosomal RNA-processing protein 17 [Iris pallida]|uniref:Ribosomal RNA-processing protein 17 n=1 Tax=Iris pallida TaxID=29817 RepID=A0AAX6F4A3_IRIPA|nr:ribosomal RNA-processing protein 17 [Iris pallida]KAJ6852219.1 ribosomal RNA-processing protein 17 [Iris pallida]
MRRRLEEEEEEEEEDEEMEGDDVVVGQIAPTMVPRHIKKRSLKNKSLSVSFSEKDLKDYVTGFHKRKKKRRKEAQKQIEEKVRLKRIEARKKRKQEKELAMYGGTLENQLAPGSEPDDLNNDGEENQLDTASVSETKTYETGFTTITVTTSELGCEDDDLMPAHPGPKQSIAVEKNNVLHVKKKPQNKNRALKGWKKGGKHGSRDRKKITRK